MIIDIRTLPDGSHIEADLCIVGGGAAAIAMTRKLSGSPLTVAILESGGLTFDDATQALAAGQRSGVPYFDLDKSRFRLLGGSTFRWGARTTPLKPIDFARRDWVSLSGWPICADTLRPYEDEIFDIVGLHRPFDYDASVWKRFGKTPPAVDDSLLEYSAFQFGKNLGLGEVFRRALEQAPNVTVYLHANVLGLRPTERGDHVEHVDVGALSGQRYIVHADRYVLASGGIENPRLLLLSDSVDPKGLCNEHDVVGRYFMEHPTASAGTVVSERWQEVLDVFTPGLLGGRLVEVGLALAPAFQERERCLNAVVRPVAIVEQDATQALRELLWLLRHRRLHSEVTSARDRAWFTDRFAAIARDPLRIVSNLVRHATGKPKRFNVESVQLQVRIEQEPNPDSRVTLAAATDAFGQRRAHLHWTMSERERRTMRLAAETFDRELRRLRMGGVEMASWLTAPELRWPDDLVGGHHHMGTTRMSADARTGVVNADQRAHAVDNLYITGSSVFPTAGYANPTMTVLALALRLGEHLRATA